MNKLYFRFGVMGSSKTAQALMTAFNFKEAGYKVLLLKPGTDTRFDDKNSEERKIVSRIGLEAPCKVFDKNTNLIDFMKDYEDINVIIVDEAQFCSTRQVEELKDLTEKYIVMCYGLKTNFKTEMFEGSKRLLELADSITEIKSICPCGAKAIVNARLKNGMVVTSGEEVEIGGNESYKALCYSCYKKYQKEKFKM